MKVAVVSEPNVPLQVENVSVRKPRSHTILHGTSFAGIFHSDLQDMTAPIPCQMCRKAPSVLGIMLVHSCCRLAENLDDFCLNGVVPAG